MLICVLVCVNRADSSPVIHRATRTSTAIVASGRKIIVVPQISTLSNKAKKALKKAFRVSKTLLIFLVSSGVGLLLLCICICLCCCCKK